MRDRRTPRQARRSTKRRSWQRTWLGLERLEVRELLSTGPLVQVTSLTPFTNTSDIAGQSGTDTLNSEVEPRLAVDPRDPKHLVGVWQQDRWSNGGSRGIVAGVSTDGGATWSTAPIPGTTVNSGGTTQRASDPWVSIGPDGTVYADYLVLNDPNVESTPRGLSASYSTDGGYHWSNPVPVITDTGFQYFNDKNSITADPALAGTAYAVWDRLYSGNGGPAMFSRTTDGGHTWSAPQVLYDPPGASGSQTLANQIRVLPSGVLVDLTVSIDYGTNVNTIQVVRSTDHGATWGLPVTVNIDNSVGIVDPDNTTQPVRAGGIIPDMAVDPATGNLYVVWQDGRFSGSSHDDIAFSLSTNGGQTWSSPVRANQTPTGLAAVNAQAFTATVAVAADGTVAVSYYDFRNNTTATGAATDAWIAFGKPDAQGNIAFGNEQRLTNSSFDIEQSPYANGYFLGDYEGLVAGGQSAYTFGAFFGESLSPSDPTSIFFRQARGPDLTLPTASPQSAALKQNTTKTVTLAGSDADGDPLRYKITALPTHGVLYDGVGKGGHLITATDLSGGSYTLAGNQATYVPNTNYYGPDNFSFRVNDGTSDSNTAAVSLSVLVPTASTLTVSDTAPPYGEPVTLTAVVTASNGSGNVVNEGGVAFYDGATYLGTASVRQGGAALPVNTLGVGSHSLHAHYNGTSNFLADDSAAAGLSVGAAATSVTVAASNAAPVAGEPITLTAFVSAVAPSTAIPTGTVVFSDGATYLGTGTLRGGTASITTSLLTVGSHSINAHYTGLAAFAAGDASPLTVSLTQGSTSVSLTASATSAAYGQPVTFTAVVSPAAPSTGTPAGNVFFYDGATYLGSGPMSGGSTALVTTTLAQGTHSITARYVNSQAFAASTSAAITVTIGPGSPPSTLTPTSPTPTSTALAGSATATVYGQTLTLTAVVSATGFAPPPGNVTFYDGATALGTRTLQNGAATLTVTTLGLGGHTLSAHYNGSGNYQASDAAPVSDTVSQAGSSTLLRLSAGSSVYGQPLALTVIVQPTNPGSGKPAGTVNFYDGATLLGSRPLTAGSAVLVVNALGVGHHTITATYVGSSTFAGSTSAAASEDVAIAPTATSVSGLPPTASVGQVVTLVAVVKPAGGSTSAPTGTVRFYDGATLIGTATIRNGAAALTVSTLSAGTHSITAVFGATTLFAGSTSDPFTLTIS